MLLPHGGPQAFEGGQDRARILPYLLDCRCLVGARTYLPSLRVVEGGLASDFCPEVLLDVGDFPPFPPLRGFDAPVGSLVFGDGAVVDRAFAKFVRITSCECFVNSFDLLVFTRIGSSACSAGCSLVCC